MADELRSGGFPGPGETMLRIDPRDLSRPLSLIFGQSTQAQLSIPMAVALSFGILFAPFITLLRVPVAYLLLEAPKRLDRRMAGPAWHQS